MAIESEVARMEQDELELIQKLQNTQILQKAAYEDLEGALNGQTSPEQQQPGSAMSKRDFSPVKSIGGGSE